MLGRPQRCDLCQFWVLGEQWRQGADDKIGTCHRMAPRPTMGWFEYEILKHLTTLSWKVSSEEEQKSKFNDYEEAYLQSCSWPSTTAIDWCAEFDSIKS